MFTFLAAMLAGEATVAPSVSSVTQTVVTNGTGCGAGATRSHSWVPNAGVVDGVHKMVFFCDPNADGYSVWRTETNPQSVTSLGASAVPVGSAPSTWAEGVGTSWTFTFKWELQLVSDSSVIQSGTFTLYRPKNTCV